MVKKTNNPSGKPLSSSQWLFEHHLAKLPERKKFLKNIFTDLKPKTIVDLGCATGLWLELANEYVDVNCKFIGIDSDKDAINEAINRSKDWNRKSSFILSDFTSFEKLPSADIYLAFNIFPYVDNAEKLLEEIRIKLNKNGHLILRQYDGAAIRFGPMEHELRLEVEKVLFNSLNGSAFFKHYDLDRVYNAIDKSNFYTKKMNLELFKRTSPYNKDFLNYFNNTIKWTTNYLSDNTADKITNWHKEHIENNHPSYFYEVDLTAILTR